MSKPNIVFILMDDMGWKDLVCTGSEFYETPNIDALCSRGVRFTNAYSASPVCSPTRASIMSGRYPASVGLTNSIGGHTQGKLLDVPFIDHLPLSEYALPEALRDGGYATWHVGKWNLGGQPYYPEKQGFDVNIGGCEWGMPSYGYFSPYQHPNLPDGPDGEYLTDRLTDEAIKLIEAHDDERPFFLNMWYHSVHIPIEAKPETIKKYEQKRIDMGLDKVDTFAVGDYFPCEHKKDQRITRRLVQSDPAYAAMVEHVDENVGRLWQTLVDTGQSENTILVFTSDNGGLATSAGSPTCNAPLSEGKGWMYEGGTREPLFIVWPGVAEAGTLCDVPVTSPDFYPTLLEMAGLPLRPEQHRDGVSMAGILRGEKAPEREAIYWHYPHYSNQGGRPCTCLRAGEWKLIEFLEENTLELYNLIEDEGETHNLADELPELSESLRGKLTAWRESIEAAMPERNLSWKPWCEADLWDLERID